MTHDRSDLVAALDAEVDPGLLELALVHRSYSYENGGVPTNERLEFLGDSVLGLVITEALYTRYPDLPEGQLAKLRAAVVNSQALAEVARTLGVGDHVYLGRGEEATGGRDKASILADTTEALLGAVFLSGGLPRARDVIRRLFDPLLDDASERGAGLDWKTSLQEAAAAAGLSAPEYRVSDVGPDHAKEFFAEVLVGGRVAGSGAGKSKKIAEQQAAQAAYSDLTSVG